MTTLKVELMIHMNLILSFHKDYFGNNTYVVVHMYICSSQDVRYYIWGKSILLQKNQCLFLALELRWYLIAKGATT